MAKLPFEKIFSGSAGSGSGGGIVPAPPNFIPWDADTNSPALSSSTPGIAGATYIVSVSGNTNLDGITDWKTFDWAIFDISANVWRKIDNTETVPDTFFGEIYFNGNDTETVISAGDTPVKIAGTYLSGSLKGFNHDTNGRLTYTGVVQGLDVIILAPTSQSFNGTSGRVTTVITKNGSPINKSEPEQDRDGASPSFSPFPAMAITTLNTNDYIEIFTKTEAGQTDNITARSLSCIVKSVGGVRSGESDDSSGIPSLSIDSTSGNISVTPIIQPQRFYIRKGNIVTVNFKLGFTTTAGGTTFIIVNLPFSPNFTTNFQAGGSADITNFPIISPLDGSKTRSVNSAGGTNQLFVDLQLGSTEQYLVTVNAWYQIQ